MKRIARLKAASPLLTREWPDPTTGEIKKINWLALHLSDGVEDFIGELAVRPTKQPDGRLEVVPPQMPVGEVCTVELEITTNETKDGKRFNKLNIVKIAKL